jgi:nitrilase
MKVAACQMVSGTTLEGNLDAARALLAQAAAQGAELAVLPEYFCLMGHKDSDKIAAREAFGEGPIQRFLSQAARELGLWVVGGTLPLTASDELHVRNTSLAYSPQGECVARYDKIHLFQFDDGERRYDEARSLTAGDQPATFDLPSREGSTKACGEPPGSITRDSSYCSRPLSKRNRWILS